MCVIIHKLYGIEPSLEAKLKARGIKDGVRICCGLAARLAR